MENNGKVRIQKIIAEAGLASRRKAEELIERGAVTVNGHPVKLGDKADPNRDRIVVAGREIKLHKDAKKYYVMLHKPRGYVTTLYGRRRALPELKSSNFNIRAFGERVALNMPIQGTAADIIKLAMVRVWRRLRDEKLAAKLLLQVHDELIVECPEDEAERVSALLQEEMEHAAQLSVPLTAEVHTGRSWAEAH